ncbi:MAG TPA: hypothetical protein VFI14_03090, partial [Chryseosolibacter sp.]|nr:hypothetical protein [Chryseosolibacter sp.]
MILYRGDKKSVITMPAYPWSSAVRSRANGKQKAGAATTSFLFSALLLILISSSVRAQVVSGMEDESRLYAESKQVNQFFRRFNGEEDEKG